MDIRKFKNWCEAATDGIIFPPDREQVRQELMNHLYDHYDDLVAQGVDRDTAQAMALAAMGSAAEIAPQLAEIHRPFWGYLLRVTRIALALTLCAVVLSWFFWLRYVDDYSAPMEGDSFMPFGVSDVSDNYDRRLFYAEPNQSAQSDGYTLTLTKAAAWRHQSMGEQGVYKEFDVFYFQIESFNPRPWAEHREIGHWFWAVDSLGNVYDSFHKGIINYAPYIGAATYHTAPLTYTYDMWISDYRSQEAEWIEFHYDRSGRDIVFRVDLTGGDAA